MKVALTTAPGIFVDGTLTGVVTGQQLYPKQNIVLEMSIAGVDDRAQVTLDAADLITIVRLADASSAPEIEKAVAEARRHPLPKKTLRVRA